MHTHKALKLKALKPIAVEKSKTVSRVTAPISQVQKKIKIASPDLNIYNNQKLTYGPNKIYYMKNRILNRNPKCTTTADVE